MLHSIVRNITLLTDKCLFFSNSLLEEQIPVTIPRFSYICIQDSRHFIQLMQQNCFMWKACSPQLTDVTLFLSALEKSVSFVQRVKMFTVMLWVFVIIVVCPIIKSSNIQNDLQVWTVWAKTPCTTLFRMDQIPCSDLVDCTTWKSICSPFVFRLAKF